MRWRWALPRRQPGQDFARHGHRHMVTIRCAQAYRITGTSKAVRWLAISSEGRASSTAGPMRGPSTSQISGRATSSRKPIRTQRITGHQGQPGKDHCRSLAGNSRRRCRTGNWNHPQHRPPLLDGGRAARADPQPSSPLSRSIIELDTKTGLERRLQLHQGEAVQAQILDQAVDR